MDILTLGDRNPTNNFLKRAVTWNENHVLDGARHITLAGYMAYITTPKGVVVVDLDKPLSPRYVTTLPLADARATAVQFRYLFVTAGDGLHVYDITEMAAPKKVPGAFIPMRDPHKLYLARTYAYVAAGPEGLIIVDIKKAQQPKIYQKVTFDGQLNDARDVIVATTNASLFAYVADGRNGFKLLQLTSPESQPNFYGFSPEPKPELIAWRKTKKPALALSKGLDRDRAVDETGHQIAILGRLGSRPFTREEMEAFFRLEDGKPFVVRDDGKNDQFVGE